MFIDKRQLAVMAGAFCAFTNLYAIQAVVPELMIELGATAAQVGFVVAVSTLAVALTAPFMGVVSDRLGRKPVMVASLGLMGVFTLLSALAGSMAELTLYRFLSSLFVPGIFTVLVAYIHEEWDVRGALQTTGFYVSGTVLGGFSGRFIAGWSAEFWGWPSAFLALGLLDFLMLPVLAFWLPASRNFRPGASLAESLRMMRGHLRNRRLTTTFAVGFGMLFGLAGVFTYVGLYLALPPFALGAGAIGSIAAVYLVSVVTTPLASRLVPRLGRMPVTVGALTLSALGLLLTLIHGLPMVIAGLAVFAAGLFVVQSVAMGYVPRVVEGSSSAAVGLYVGCYYIGGALGAYVPAAFWRAWGWPGCVALMCCVLAAMAGICVRLWGRERPLAEVSAALSSD